MSEQPREAGTTNRVPLIVLAWAWVVLPFAYGVYQLFLKLVQLFG
ncbi:MFS transporter small subunit [Amycolatopsis sp. NPDC004378]